MAQAARKFTTRFVGLVIAGYLIGLISVAWAVWLVSQPILADMTTRSLTDLLRVEASAFAGELDRHLDAVEYLSQEDALKEFTAGFAEFRSTTEDLLSILMSDVAVRSAVIYEFTGDAILQRDEEGARLGRPEFSPALGSLVERLLEGSSPSLRPDLRLFAGRSGADTHFAIVQPIQYRGLTEGVLVVEIALDLAGYLPAGTYIDGPVLASTSSLPTVSDFLDDPEILRQPITGTELRLITSPDSAMTETTGRNLVTSVLKALVVVLALPFLAIIVVGYRVIVAPQEQLAKSEQALTEQRNELAELAAIVHAFHDAILTTDADQRILWVNPAFERLTGFSEADALGRRLSDFLEKPGENEAANAEMQLAYAACGTVRTELLYHRSDGTPVWVSAIVTPVHDEDGVVLHFAAILSDITTNKVYENELKRQQEETRHRSLHDALTGLPNRRYFDEIIAPLSQEPNNDRCLVRIDLDHFKAVNDSFGHAAGDEVLCVVAEHMRTWCDREDFPARVGGDEFLILMAEGKSEAEADILCQSLQREISKDIPFEGSICRVGASFGIASSFVSFVDLKDLLVCADAALYKSKDEGRNRITLYTPELHAQVQESRRISIELEAAIEREEFEPWFQPQFDSVSGELVGVEALARWIHPTRGVVEPWRFMPSIEKLSLTDEMDSIIYRKGLKAVEELQARGINIPRISFNVSNQQIENPLLGSIAESFSLPDTMISLEILESVVIEEMSDDKLSNLFALRERGFRLELDDFGSGHASIAGLLKLRPDVIKIDKVLVQPVVRSTVAQELISSIVDIGRALGVEITAEGAETRDHVEILRGCGCRYLQGFYFSRAIPMEKLAQRIQSNDFPGVGSDDWSVGPDDTADNKKSA